MDIFQRRGIYPRKLLFVPGLEAAGMVEVIGKGVTNVKPGNRVGYTGQPGSCQLPRESEQHLQALACEIHGPSNVPSCLAAGMLRPVRMKNPGAAK